MIEFIVIKRDAIQGFKEPAVLTAQFIRELSEPQGFAFTIAASLNVLVKPVEMVIVRICEITGLRVTKLLLDVMKPFEQVRAAHSFVEEIE